jgi:tetraacyldisaccharide-1-P 4'-kinase
VILSRIEVDHSYDEVIEKIRRYKPAIPCILARQKLVSVRKLGEEEALPMEAVRGLAVVAFAGIGNPSQFLTTLRQAGIQVVHSLFFPDHHYYQTRDYQRLVHECEKFNVNVLITTEKDAEKISAENFAPRKVFAAKLAFEFDDFHSLSRLLSEVAGVTAR